MSLSISRTAGQSQAILIKFAVLNLMLIALTMIPGWIAATQIEEGINSYFSFIFYSLEQSCASIDDLEKIIVNYNKAKFIENNKYPDKSTFVYLTNKTISPDEKELNITFFDKSAPSKIDISKRVLLDREKNIIISTTSKAILENILPSHIEPFYHFDIKKIADPLWMVKPKLSLVIFIFILSALLTVLWTTMKATLTFKKNFKIKSDEFEITNRFKTAYISFLNLTLYHIYEDLNYVFQTANIELKSQRIILDKKMDNIRESLGRMITFGTLKRDYSKIELTQEINMAIDCFFDQITDKKINVIKHNFDNNIYIKQTKPKNLLIILSILHYFIINLPPKGQLLITIDIKDCHSIKVVFADNMPVNWKLFTHKKGTTKSLNNLLLTFDKLMYACADEEIETKQGNDNSGNYFTLDYKLNRTRNKPNVIQGFFK